MSKRDTFVKNIRAITRCETFEEAVVGWTVKRVISQSLLDLTAKCELCGTHFRNGVVVERPMGAGVNSITITIGGICLRTILLHRFTDPTLVPKRKGATLRMLKTIYHGIVDPGAWITWIVETAPREFAPIVADLKHLGMVASDEALQALVVFHDRTRIYPRAALIPDWRVSLGGVPSSLTMDQARHLMNGFSPAVCEHMTQIAQYANRYRRIFLRKLGSTYEAWSKAWNRLDDLSCRMVTALSAVGDRMRDGLAGPPGFELASLPAELCTPIIVWSPTEGLGLIQRGKVSGDTALVRLWRVQGFKRYKLSYWRTVGRSSLRSVLEVEAEAFGERPG